eukprot:5755157-Amphidinium_carterae.1
MSEVILVWQLTVRLLRRHMSISLILSHAALARLRIAHGCFSRFMPAWTMSKQFPAVLMRALTA